MLPRVHEYIYIQSYKHDKSLHRTWSKAFVMEANDKRMIAITDRSFVVEADGRKWLTREPAICFFYPDKWYNVICMIRKRGIFYYCNIASPSVYDEEALKNIDYDLDVKVDNFYHATILDEDEYVLHKQEMQYSDELDHILHQELDTLLNDIKQLKSPFEHTEIEAIYEAYLTQKSQGGR
ncbi:MAG: DUF402 domain-containing protein [Breznakia sp.]